MKKVLVGLILPLVMTSCSDSDSSEMILELDPAIILIEQEIFTKVSGEIVTADFTYDGNRLISAKSSDGHEFSYTYENDLLSRVDLSQNGNVIIFAELDYNGDQLSSYTAYFDDNSADRFDFNYNSENLILVEKYSGDYTDQTYENEINITLENENIKSVAFSGYSLQYEYDSQNCVYKNIFAIGVLNFIGLDFGGFEGVTHNPVSRFRSFLAESESQTFDHTYNSIGFPETTDVYLDGELEGTIEYFYR